MVDLKFLLNHDVVKKAELLRRRCRKANQAINCNLDRRNIKDICSCSGRNQEECEEEDESNPNLKKRHILGAAALVIVIVLIVVAYFTGVFNSPKSGGENALVPADPTKALPPSASVMRVFKRAAVCADSAVCAQVGKDILEKNGTAVDAAIATLFCNGVVTMQSMGLGGGFLMTIYKRDEKKAYFLNAREKAPINAKNELYKDNEKTSQNGPLAIAVPGELKGYWELHKRFGTLKWEELIQPTIDLCNNGYNMTMHQYTSLFKNKINYDDENFKEWFKDDKGNFRTAGSKIIPRKLCKTLTLIALNGGDSLYNGTLSKMFLEDIKEIGGIITAEDLAQYEAQWMDPVSVQFKNSDTLYTAPPPGSGAILGFIMGILDGYNFNGKSVSNLNRTITTYHRIIESFKYAYAKRTELGDTNFVNISELLANLTSKEYAENIRKQIVDNATFDDPKHYGAVFYDKGDHGTAHISIVDQNGDAVSVTSSINLYFGAGMTSKQTGIIFNSVMDDFSFPYFKNYFGIPGSPNNEMKPGKRPLSSMSPTIIVDKNSDTKMVVGGSGGTVITTSVAWTIIRSLWFGENIKEAVDAPRIHHQLYPMLVRYEYGVLQQVVDGLKALGHKMKRELVSVVCALTKDKDRINANADHRKGGDVYGLS
ncbi:glutathione hydrolase 1 proenzyme-like isoform X1 [Sitophilus oryzae]|uniref:Glutathione hydrolase 1 proenzyme-like isoform X1 n=1 Tax=Sitophilus oryzae TaxID=7048 RepID=A0A6J2YMV8_SITOR|nr:glutathione hydrolase 1 proenzyme-like isoform X1 [Sitophilus oryzae]